MEHSFKELEKVDYNNMPVKVTKFWRQAEKACFPLHWHDRMELLRIDSGFMQVHCGNTNFTVKENDIVVINSKETHSAIAGNEGVGYTCVMFELAPYINNIYYGQSHITPLLYRQMRFKNIVSDKKLHSIIDRLDDLCQNNQPWRAMYSEAQILEILAILTEKYIDEETSSAAADTRFTEVLDYIDTHFSLELTIPYLAQKFGYDKSYFCRKFKAQTGITCTEYINSLRLDHAAIMLKGSTESITDIALKCGFADANYFSRCFKEKYGVSPLAWRKN